MKCVENTVNATEGDSSINLSCNAADVGHEVVKEVDWRYSSDATEVDFIFLSGGNKGVHYRPLKHVLDTSDNTTLIINYIRVADTGLYTCVEDYGLGCQHLHHLTVWPQCQIYSLTSWILE